MPKPLIGIVCGLSERTDTVAYAIPAAYSKAVAMAGGLPLLITPNLVESEIREIYERLDGILLAGGGDVDPRNYGMNSDNLVHGVDPTRDAVEIGLIRWSLADDRPLLGICRGCQISNVALGGTLYRDILTEFPDHDGTEHDYWKKAPRNYQAHHVAVNTDSRLATILGDEHPLVNSLHHQALHKVAPQFAISALSPDGIIEGVEIRDARFFIGVQWHPEELVERNDSMRRLFQAFIQATK